MIRRCDGTDPNLIAYVDGDRPVLQHPLLDYPWVPCSCGKRFDDVDRSVVWPHSEIFSGSELAYNGRKC